MLDFDAWVIRGVATVEIVAYSRRVIVFKYQLEKFFFYLVIERLKLIFERLSKGGVVFAPLVEGLAANPNAPAKVGYNAK